MEAPSTGSDLVALALVAGIVPLQMMQRRAAATSPAGGPGTGEGRAGGAAPVPDEPAKAADEPGERAQAPGR